MEKKVCCAQATVTAPVIYTTAAGTGGPLLWNGSNNVVANILAIGWGLSVVTTVATQLGFTGGTGQPNAPSSTTAADGRANLYLGGGASAVTPYRVGTVALAGAFLVPVGELHTGALTVANDTTHWVNVDGLCVVPPFCWWSIAAGATATTTVGNFSVIWEEIEI